MRAIESMAMEVLNHDELAAILGDLAIETHSNAMTTQSPDWQIAKDVFVSLAENRLFFRHEMICAVDAPTDILYSEMLVRMKVDDQVLLPGRFIPALERLSLMRPFDRFVLGRTLDALRAIPGKHLGCNVSAQSVRDDHWWKSLFLELAAEPEVASRLVVEITESAPVSPVDGRAFVQLLRRLGVRVAIDDFGAGFSADAARMCEPDIIKIDRSFLRHVRLGTLCIPEFDRLVRVAQDIAPIVVVEGVETPDDVRIARDAGAPWIQGYTITAPDAPASIATD